MNAHSYPGHNPNSGHESACAAGNDAGGIYARCERLVLLYAINSARKAHRPTKRLRQLLRAATARCV